MVDIPPEAVQDPWEKNEPGLGGLGRDPERTPMPWDGSANGGLHTRAALAAARPGFRDPSRRRAVAGPEVDPDPLPPANRAAPRAAAIWSVGDYALVETDGDVLAYERCHRGERLLVALNLGREPRTVAIPKAARGRSCSTHLDRAEGGTGPNIEPGRPKA